MSSPVSASCTAWAANAPVSSCAHGSDPPAEDADAANRRASPGVRTGGRARSWSTKVSPPPEPSRPVPDEAGIPGVDDGVRIRRVRCDPYTAGAEPVGEHVHEGGRRRGGTGGVQQPPPAERAAHGQPGDQPGGGVGRVQPEVGGEPGDAGDERGVAEVVGDVGETAAGVETVGSTGDGVGGELGLQAERTQHLPGVGGAVDESAPRGGNARTEGGDVVVPPGATVGGGGSDDVDAPHLRPPWGRDAIAAGTPASRAGCRRSRDRRTPTRCCRWPLPRRTRRGASP